MTIQPFWSSKLLFGAWQVVRGKKWTHSEHFNQIIWIHNPKSNFKMYNIFYSIDKIRIILQFSVSIKSTCIHIFPLSAASLYHYLFPDPDSLVWIFLARQTLFRVPDSIFLVVIFSLNGLYITRITRNNSNCWLLQITAILDITLSTYP